MQTVPEAAKILHVFQWPELLSLRDFTHLQVNKLFSLMGKREVYKISGMVTVVTRVAAFVMAV